MSDKPKYVFFPPNASMKLCEIETKEWINSNQQDDDLRPYSKNPTDITIKLNNAIQMPQSFSIFLINPLNINSSRLKTLSTSVLSPFNSPSRSSLIKIACSTAALITSIFLSFPCVSKIHPRKIKPVTTLYFAKFCSPSFPFGGKWTK